MDFGFSRYDLNKITKRIELPEITPPEQSTPITLIVRCAVNRAFAAALFKLAAPEKPEGEAPAGSTALVAAEKPEDEDTARRRNAQLYAGTVLVDWEGVAVNGQPVPFSPEAAEEFLYQLMTHVPDVWNRRVRNFADEVSNFRPARKTVDPVDLGKEPPRG